jgi:hypothetical protein
MCFDPNFLVHLENQPYAAPMAQTRRPPAFERFTLVTISFRQIALHF